jgi:hypothetical protein
MRRYDHMRLAITIPNAGILELRLGSHETLVSALRTAHAQPDVGREDRMGQAERALVGSSPIRDD